MMKLSAFMWLAQSGPGTFLGVLSVSYNTLFISKNSKPGSKCKEIRADDLYIYKSVRFTMLEERLNLLAVLNIHRDICNKVVEEDMDKLIKKFAEGSGRKLYFF